MITSLLLLCCLTPLWLLVGKACSKLRLPSISGFILAGVASGPHFFSILNPTLLQDLRFVEHICLSYIALLAGAELHFPGIRHLRRQVFHTTIGISFFSWALVFAVSLLASNTVPFLSSLPAPELLAVCNLLGVLAIARSPAAALAVMKEVHGNGSFCSLVIAVVDMKDILVFLAFAVALKYAEQAAASVGGGPPIHISSAIIDPVLGILSSLLLGVGGGLVLSRTWHSSPTFPSTLNSPQLERYQYYIKALIPLVFSSFIYFTSQKLKAEPLLACVFLGATAANTAAAAAAATQGSKNIVSLFGGGGGGSGGGTLDVDVVGAKAHQSPAPPPRHQQHQHHRHHHHHHDHHHRTGSGTGGGTGGHEDTVIPLSLSMNESSSFPTLTSVATPPPPSPIALPLTLGTLLSPISAVLFGLVGSGLHVDKIVRNLGLAIVLFSVRILGIWIGAWVGGSSGKVPPELKSRLWMGMLTQAGIAMGLTRVVVARCNARWGPDFEALMAAIVIGNLMVGPPMFRAAIHAAGEDHVGVGVGVGGGGGVGGVLGVFSSSSRQDLDGGSSGMVGETPVKKAQQQQLTMIPIIDLPPTTPKVVL